MKRNFALVFAATLAATLAASPAAAQGVELDPAGSSPMLSALNWLQGSLMGNVATAARSSPSASSAS